MNPRAASADRRFRAGLAALVLLTLIAADASATTIQLIVNRDTGETFLKNEGVSTAPIDAYTLTSASSQLLVGNWTPIAGNYDTAGDMSVDDFAAWFALPGSGADLSEFSLTPLSGALNAGQAISLGTVYPIAGPEDLEIAIAADNTIANVVADFRTLTADYDGDLDVDLDDYGVFATTFGSTVDLRADGNADGVIDAADFTVWRDSDELALTPPSMAFARSESVFSSAVPEPAGIALSFAAVSLLLARRRAAA